MTHQQKLLNDARNAQNTGDINNARKSLFKIKNYHTNHEALYLLAVCHAINNDFAKAEELFKKTIKLSPPTDALLGNLGLAQLHQKKFNEAIESYLGAVKINPGFYDALVNLSSSYDFLNKNDQAVNYAQKAHRINGNNPVTLNILAKHAITEDRLSDAIKLYNSSLALQPGLPQTYAQLSNAYFLANNYKLAEET